jgi:hypothetical protein
MTARELAAQLALWPPDARVLVEYQPGRCTPPVRVADWADDSAPELQPGQVGLLLLKREDLP